MSNGWRGIKWKGLGERSSDSKEVSGSDMVVAEKRRGKVRNENTVRSG